MTRCDDLVDSLEIVQPRYFTALDLVQGYHQQLMHPDSIQKTAFSVPGGHFEYLRLPMGLCNSTASFQRLQDHVLRGLPQQNVKVYLDDLLLVTQTILDRLPYYTRFCNT